MVRVPHLEEDEAARDWRVEGERARATALVDVEASMGCEELAADCSDCLLGGIVVRLEGLCEGHGHGIRGLTPALGLALCFPCKLI